MSKAGISTQQARRDNLKAFEEYIQHLIARKIDWPRNQQTKEISILAIESAIKKSGKSFNRKYLQNPQSNQNDVFVQRFLRAKEEVRNVLAESESAVNLPIKGPFRRAAIDPCDNFPFTEKDARHSSGISNTSREFAALRVESAQQKEEIAHLKRLLAQFELVEAIGISTGKTILPTYVPRVSSVEF